MIEASHTDRQSTLLVRSEGPIYDPSWAVEPVGMEDLVLAYMSRAVDTGAGPRNPLAPTAMIRLSWRQFRLQAALSAAGLAIVAIALAITGPHLVDLYNSTVAGCRARGSCQSAINSFVDTDRFLQHAITALLFVAPALIGIFWGAPSIARELETGSFRLAWTQSVTRTRWLGSKLALVGGSAMVATGLLSLMVTWWFTRSTEPMPTSSHRSCSTRATSSRSATPHSPSRSASQPAS